MLNGSKGFNQIDFAVGVSIIILMMSITVSYLTTTIVTPISTYSTSELRTKAENLNYVAFKTEGIPNDWHWLNRSIRPSLGSYIFKRRIYLEEYNGSDNLNKNIEINFDLDEKAYLNSLIVYEGNKSLPTHITNPVDLDNDGFLEEVDLIFQVNVSANSRKTLDLYYSKENDTNSHYSSLVPESHTLNITLFSERKVGSISGQKMEQLGKMNYMTAKDRFAIKRNFYLMVENKTSTIWEFGRRENNGYSGLPNRTDVILFSDNSIYQDDNGEIDSVKTITTVW
ncbi:MAG: hypothetical protein ABEK17_00970 [Candidatus Aenigmatarchaeota archaeon]